MLARPIATPGGYIYIYIFFFFLWQWLGATRARGPLPAPLRFEKLPCFWVTRASSLAVSKSFRAVLLFCSCGVIPIRKGAFNYAARSKPAESVGVNEEQSQSQSGASGAVWVSEEHNQTRVRVALCGSVRHRARASRVRVAQTQ